MRANTPTLLPLYDFARILQIHPLHFGGVDLGFLHLQHVHCDQAMVQFAWQVADRTSREGIAIALQTAERQIAEVLRYNPAPAWHVDELHSTIQPWDPNLVNVGGLAVGGFRQNVRTTYGYVISGGRRNLHNILDFLAFGWEDGGYWQRGVLTATVPEGTAACELHLYYPDHQADPAWEIRPIEVEISGLVATISFPRECAVKEEFFNTLAPVGVDGDDDTQFLDHFSLYRETIDPDNQLRMLWQPTGRSCFCTGETTCDDCAHQELDGCFSLTDAKLGIVAPSPARWSSTSWPTWFYGRQPDQVKLSYLAGFENGLNACPRTQMDDAHARAVVYYACSLLERSICNCTADTWRYWREDQSEVKFVAQAMKRTPFGTRRGAVYAWDFCMRNTLGNSGPN